MTELADITKLLMLAAASYGNRFEATEATAKVWHRYLKEFDMQALTHAFDAHIATQNWPPTPADIRGLIREKRKLAAPTGEDAWNLCCRAAGGSGMNNYDEMLAFVRERDPVAYRTAYAIGWHRICLTDYENLHYVQREFVKHYEGLLERGERMEALQVEGPERDEARAILGNLQAKILAADHPALPSGDKADA